MGRWAQRQRRGTSVTPSPPRVVSVTRVDVTHADWLFDLPVTVLGTCTQCKIQGTGPVASVQQGANTMRGTYGSVNTGVAWTLTLSEPQLSPRPFTGQSGLVI